MELEMPAEMRARFGYGPERPCATVNGVPFRGVQMSVAGQGFGDFRFASGLPRAGCIVEVPVGFLLERMEREHADFVAVSIAFPGDDPFEQAQREHGWLAPRDVLADPVLLPRALTDGGRRAARSVQKNL